MGHGVAFGGRVVGFSSSPGGANDGVQLGGGTLAFTGTNAITFSLTDGLLGPGTYDISAGGAATTGGLANLSATFPAGARQTFALAVPPGKVQIVVTGDPATLTWTGGTNGTWNGTDVNWSGESPKTFFNFNAVVFDDTAANRSVTIAGSVAPRSVLVNTALGPALGGSGPRSVECSRAQARCSPSPTRAGRWAARGFIG